MTLSTKDVKHIAKLARLNISEKETEKFKKQLSAVVSFVSELNEVDTKAVEPTRQTTKLKNSLRDDLSDNKDSLTQEEATSQTENTHNGYFVTERLIDNEE